LIGQGAFGPVYKAQMSTGEIVAVKVLATDSKQGEKEFQTEVMLLGRLHHRNLVNLIGYCAEKGQHMLIYVYMSKGSLASHLYSK
jgi:serine/threonine protein kinase